MERPYDTLAAPPRRRDVDLILVLGALRDPARAGDLFEAPVSEDRALGNDRGTAETTPRPAKRRLA